MMYPEIPLGNCVLKKSVSIDPSRFIDEVFELYSIPSYDNAIPEIAEGRIIGSSKKCVNDGDVLLSRIVPHIRRCWVVTSHTQNRKIASGEWIIFRGDTFFSKYLRYFLICDTFHNQFMSTVSGIGGSLMRAKPSLVEKIKIPLPPLPIQKKIAAILDAADALKQKDKALIAKYNELTQSLFLDMFGDPVINPKGWDVKSLSSCISMKGGGTPSKNKPEYFTGSIPWVSPKDMKYHFITTSKEKITDEAVNNSSAKIIDKYSVLIVIRSGILKKKLPLAINLVPVTINQDLKALQCKKMINPYFLMHQLMAQKSKILQTVRGTTADNISTDIIKKIKTILPNIELQNQFAERIKLIEQQKQLAEESLKKSEDLFNCLLQKAFTGELMS